MNGDPNNEAPNQNKIERLIVGHFEGNLDSDQESQLAAAISTSTESKALFLSHMRMEGRLHSMGRDGFLFAEDAQSNGGRLDAMTVTPNKPGCSVDAFQSGGSAPGNAQSGYRRRSSLWVASSYITACSILIATFCWGLWPSSVDASSVLRKAQNAAAELIDRTYRVTIFGMKDRSQSRDFTINVRGGGRFVIKTADDDHVIGSDATDFWVVQQNGPVYVTSDFRLLAPDLRKNIPSMRLLRTAASPNEPLLLGISDLLSVIERKYDVEIVESDSVKEYHVRARSNSRRPNYPEVVDLWSDVETGVVLRIESKFANGRQRQFELIETAKLPQQWYHYREHAPGREVERIHATD